MYTVGQRVRVRGNVTPVLLQGLEGTVVFYRKPLKRTHMPRSFSTRVRFPHPTNPEFLDLVKDYSDTEPAGAFEEWFFDGELEVLEG